MTETLKYPAGEWTHAEFAEANGKTKPSVYNQLRQAIKNGTVVVCGSRSSGGRGKPSKLYKVVNGNTPVVIPTKVEVKSEVPPEPVVTESVVTATVTKPVVSKEADKKIDDVSVLPKKHLTNLTCPICHNKVYSWRTPTGIMVMCQQPIEICKSTENPFGHGRTEKDAYEIMVAKWTFGKNRAN